MSQEKAVEKSRVIIFALSGIAALLLIAVVWAVGLPYLGLAPHRVFEARLSVTAMVNEAQIHHGFPIDTWFFYDRQGREVGEISGGDDDQFRGSLNAIFTLLEPVGSTRTLAWEISRMVDKNDHPLRPLPQADLTIVKYWDGSCEECLERHHSAVGVVKKLLAGRGSLTVNTLYVDVDIEKRLAESNRQKQN